MSKLKIRPLHVGTIKRPIIVFMFSPEPGKLIDAPLVCWYIEGAEKKILVDTGGGDPAESNRPPYTRKKEQAIENALINIGVSCDEIDIVINTHLHWDHCSGNQLFPNAKIIVQKAELKSAQSPFPIHASGYNKKMIEDIDYTVIQGDTDIVEGVKAILTPGHTYGMQGVVVKAETNNYFIAADTISLYDSMTVNPPLISGINVDLQKYYNSLKKIEQLSAIVIPGHDFGVFKKEVYD